MSDEERVTLIREFPAELATSGDGRTIEMRIVPYNVPATVADPPDFRPYQELFLPGAFERQLRAPNRVAAWLNVEHEQGIRGIIGHGTDLRDSPEGLHGTFRVLKNEDGDKALALVNEGLLTGVSLEFDPIKSARRDNVVSRVRAHLKGVALARAGLQAFKTAEVLAVRMAPEQEPLVEASPMSADLAERLAGVGYVPLQRVAVTRKPWDSAQSRFTDEEYQRSCLLDGRLPVLEPDGALNVNALGAAAGALNRTPVTVEAKAAAARKLLRYYRLAEIDPPASVTRLART